MMHLLWCKTAAVQVVDKEYRVVYSSGLDTGKEMLSAEEFTKFLIESRASPTITISSISPKVSSG